MDWMNDDQFSGNGSDESYYDTSSQLISEGTRVAIFSILFVFFSTFFILGIFANVVNILVYREMGFSAPINVSFMSLSISDLVTCCLKVVEQFGTHPLYLNDTTWGIVKYVNPVSYACASFTSWITTIITLERCFCVVFPMKVKLIFTRTTITALVIVMLIYQLATVAPHFVAIAMGDAAASTSPTYPTNQTNENNMFSMTSVFGNQSDDGEFWSSDYDADIGILSLLLSYSLPSTICFVFVIIGTIFLVVGLERSTQFRRSAASTNKPVESSSSTKENRVARLVVVVCVIYIVCFSPSVAVILIPLLWPPFERFNPRYGNIVSVMFMVSNLFHSISSSVNIVIYLLMSRQYKEAFNKLFICR